MPPSNKTISDDVVGMALFNATALLEIWQSQIVAMRVLTLIAKQHGATDAEIKKAHEDVDKAHGEIISLSAEQLIAVATRSEKILADIPRDPSRLLGQMRELIARVSQSAQH